MMQRVRVYEQVRQEGNDAILQHVGLVKRVALHLKVRLPPMMELAELIQIGMIGLLEASRTYDASKGVDFEEYDISMGGPKRAEMLERSNGGSTVPQIFIDDRHVGGCDDIFALDRQGKLDPLLAA